MSAATHRQDGFTLLEVLVAFAILAMGLSLVMAIFSTSLGETRRAEKQVMAVMIAESRLAEIGTAIPLSPGTHEGRDEADFWWRTDVRPHQPERRWTTVIPYDVTVSVGWGDPRATNPVVHLTGLRLATARP